MSLPVAYEENDIAPGVLPPAYGGGWAIPGQLQPAYGNTSSFDFTNPNIAFDPRITFTRSTIANRFNSAGVLTSTAIDVARASANQDYNPSTLAARGFYIEAAATNGIRNPRFEGAVAGTPGTNPTYMSISTTDAELVRTIVGTGTEDGIPYIDVQISGTMTDSRDWDIQLEDIVQNAALAAQSWTQAVYLREVGGSQTNVAFISLQANTYTAASAYVNSPWANNAETVTTAALRTQRFSRSATLSGATIAYIAPFLKIRTATSGAVNFTLRIGAPQLEQSAFATSIILPPVASPAATSRDSDKPSILSLPSIGFNSAQGTLYAEFMVEGLGGSTNPVVVSINDNTNNNYLILRVLDSASDNVNFIVVTGGVTQASITGPVITANTLVKAAISWNANSSRLAVNGTGYTEDVSGTVPAVTQMQFGTHRGSEHLNGWEPTVRYYPQQFTQAQLNALTA